MAYGERHRSFNLAVLPVLAALCLLWLGAGAQARSFDILAFGDSLAAGYGLRAEQGFAAQLERSLRERGIAAQVRNGGVSGDTTAAGLARLEWALAEPVDLVILELGANDALRGVPPKETERNLSRMLEILREREIPVLLAGMRAPRNLGDRYVEAFDGIYPRLAARFDVPLYPFFLDGVATRPAFNQGDGIHPNAAGVREIVERITPHVVGVLEAEGR